MPRTKGNPAAGHGGAQEKANASACINKETAPEKQDRPSFTLTLVALPGCADPIRQLRALLKRALRDHQLKCISISEV